MRAIEFIFENTTTLKKLYGNNLPDKNELFWDYINTTDLSRELEIKSLPNYKLKILLLGQYRAEHVDDIVDMLSDEQKEILDNYINDINLSKQTIIIADNKVIDGNHRALAALLKGSSINYIDLDDIELDESVKSHLAAMGLGAALGLGGMGAQQYYDFPKNLMKTPSAVSTVTQPTQTVQQPSSIKPSDVQKTEPMSTVKKPEPLKPVEPTTDRPLTKRDILYNTAIKVGLEGKELAQFMGQMAHESQNFTRMEENFKGDPYQYFMKRYDKKYNPEKAKILGNIYAGDGYRFRGRGYVMLTGRYNYQKIGEMLGIDLIKNPDLASVPEVAAYIAIEYWILRVKPNVKDFEHIEQVTKNINAGLAGMKDRMAQYARFKNELDIREGTIS